MCDKFASKCAANPLFAKWFPLKTTRTSARQAKGAEVYGTWNQKHAVIDWQIHPSFTLDAGWMVRKENDTEKDTKNTGNDTDRQEDSGVEERTHWIKSPNPMFYGIPIIEKRPPDGRFFLSVPLNV